MRRQGRKDGPSGQGSRRTFFCRGKGAGREGEREGAAGGEEIGTARPCLPAVRQGGKTLSLRGEKRRKRRGARQDFARIFPGRGRAAGRFGRLMLSGRVRQGRGMIVGRSGREGFRARLGVRFQAFGGPLRHEKRPGKIPGLFCVFDGRRVTPFRRRPRRAWRR